MQTLHQSAQSLQEYQLHTRIHFMFSSSQQP